LEYEDENKKVLEIIKLTTAHDFLNGYFHMIHVLKHPKQEYQAFTFIDICSKLSSLFNGMMRVDST